MNLSDLAWTVVRTSEQASVLIVIVLGVQWMVSSRIPAAWRYALWLPVILRLLLPITPESRFSLFNLFTRTPTPIPHYQFSVTTAPRRTIPVVLPEETLPVVQRERVSWKPSAIEVAGGGWFALALLLMLRSIFGNWRCGRKLAQFQSIRDERVIALFEVARRDLGVTRKVNLVEHATVGSPALFGAIRPRLLLPSGLGQKFSDRELRHIFLHELAHIKRGDLYVNWVLVVLQAVHWFNPLVWWAAGRIRSDREFACDAMALDYANEFKPVEFGETMVKVLETFSGFQRAAGTIAVVQDRSELKRRIRMIATYRPARRGAVFWATLLIGICVAGLSDAQTKSERLNSQITAAQTQDSRTNVVQKNLVEIHDTEAPKGENAHLTGAPLISNRLETITIPEFGIPVETPLSEVIKTLSKEVKEHDPKRKGINFLLSSQTDRPGPDEPALMEDFKIKVSPPLRNARVLDVLEAIKTGVVPRGELPTGRPLKYSDRRICRRVYVVCREPALLTYIQTEQRQLS